MIKTVERWCEVKAASVNVCGEVHRRNVAAALREDIAEVEAFDADNPNLPAMRQTLRETLEGDTSVATVQSQGDYDILIQGLSSLAKTRALYQATHRAASELLDSVEPTDLVSRSLHVRCA